MTRVYSSLIYAGLVICPKSGTRQKLTTYDNICPQLGYNRRILGHTLASRRRDTVLVCKLIFIEGSTGAGSHGSQGTDTVGGRSTSAVAGVKLDVLD